MTSPSQIRVDSIVNTDGTSRPFLVQRTHVTANSFATTTSAIPFDNTTPQISEGGLFLTANHTPLNANNSLKISVFTYLAHSSTSIKLTAALFQDSGVNAIAVGGAFSSATASVVVPCFIAPYFMTANTVNPIAFTVRCGGSTGATLTFNGAAGADIYNGALISSILIEEFEA